MNGDPLFDDNTVTIPQYQSKEIPKVAIDETQEPKYLWIAYLITGIIVLISFSLSIISATNPTKIQVLVSVPPDFTDGFTMQKTLTANTAEILGATSIVETHTATQITTQHEIVQTNFSIGSQTITASDITNFSTKNVFLNLVLNTTIPIPIEIKSITTLFLPLTGFSANKFTVSQNPNLFDFKSNNTALALGKLSNGAYCITLRMNLPAAINSTNTKIVPIIVAYDDTISEWVPMNPGLLSSVDYMQNQIGAKYIWNVTFGFMSTGSFAVFPVFPNATRVGFQIFVRYGIGQTTSISWNISELQFSITQI